MSKSIKYLLLFSLAINFAGLATAGYIQFIVGPRPFVKYFAERHILFIDKRLKLTPEQEDAFIKSQEKFLTNMESNFPNMHEKRLEMIKQLVAPNVDRPKLNHSVDDVRDAQDRFYRMWVDYILELRSVLTPEQQETFAIVFREKITHPLSAPSAQKLDAMPETAPKSAK